MTTLCIGILQRVDISNKRTQALILVNTNSDAQQFRQIINDLCHGDTDVNANTTTTLRPTTILINTVNVVHDMIVHQTINSEDVKICCFDDGEKVFNRQSQSSGHMSGVQLSPALQSIHNWLPGDVQMVVTLSTITGDVMEVTAQVMSHPMTIVVYDGEAQEDNV
jgi:superfamily II DNA/RNA helicase